MGIRRVTFVALLSGVGKWKIQIRQQRKVRNGKSNCSNNHLPKIISYWLEKREKLDNSKNQWEKLIVEEVFPVGPVLKLNMKRHM